jgi:hypothetical protein
MDEALTLANAWHRQHEWLEQCIDELTIESRHARQCRDRLREEARQRGEEARDLAEVAGLAGGGASIRRVA